MQIEDMVALGNRLTLAINAKGFHGKRAELCRNLEIHPSSLSDWEAGKKQIGLDNLVKLSRKLEISLDEVVFGHKTVHNMDYDPLEGQMRHAIIEGQKENHRNYLAFTQIALKIGGLIEKAADGIVEAARKQHTMFPDRSYIDMDEAYVLESYSIDTLVASRNMRYNYRDKARSSGIFDTINARNLRQGRSYRFLMDGHLAEHEEGIARHQNYLIELSGSEQNVLLKCAFACIENFPIVNFAIYKMDIKSLKSDRPILYSLLEDRIHNDAGTYAGFFMLPSHESPACFLMDKEDVSYTTAIFNRLWEKAAKINSFSLRKGVLRGGSLSGPTMQPG